jgi:DNA-binding transcriptional MocR family regulator
MSRTARATSPISGSSSAGIAESIERAVREGSLEPGAALPTVRALAATLSVSTSTVADAYRTLRQRGLLRTDGRRGTTIARRPPLSTVWSPPPPAPGVRNLADGNPDPALLPPLGPMLRQSAAEPALYGGPRKLPELVRTVIRDFKEDGIISGDVAVVAGAIDGIGRVLQAHVGLGDRVAVEDPTFPPLFDLLGALGLETEPVAVDEEGPVSTSVERALHEGARALVMTSRAQNPTGAAVSAERSRELRRLLRRHPDVLVVEDDTGGAATADDLAPVTDVTRATWAFVRSFSMIFGPDVRTAVVAADAVTLSRLEGKQWVSGGWVSHILQRLVWLLLTDTETKALVRSARAAYQERRSVLVEALSERGVDVMSHSGFNVWIPVTRESTTVSLLQAAGWAVASGEPFRVESGPGIRVTASTLTAPDANAFAEALVAASVPGTATYAG